ncbi:MAG: hypothetical protein HY738_18735, partial [Bacteroidia bacterium]|nr:hypothetical protein [Bacteroidia bacterium]
MPVKVANFNNIVSIQGTIEFNDSVASYYSVEQFGLPGMNSSNFGITQAANGKITFLWFDETLAGVTLSDSSVIFAIKFTLVGNTGQQTLVSFTSSITQLEFVDNTFNILPYNLVNGAVTITGTPPASEVTIKIDSVETTAGVQVLIPVRVFDFNSIVSMQGTIEFDPAVVNYITVEQFGLPDLAISNFGTSQIASGKLTFSWFDNTLAGQTKPDNSTIFAIKFNVIGSEGQSSTLNFSSSVTPLEFIDTSLTPLIFNTVAGLVNITSTPVSQQLTLMLDSVAGPYNSQLFVKARAKNFNNIISLQGTIEFDPTVAIYLNVEQFGLPGLIISNFGTSQASSGIITFSWNDATLAGIDKPDSSVLFAIRYRIKGTLGEHTNVNFINAPTPVEIIDSAFTPIIPVLISGHIEVLNTNVIVTESLPTDTFCVGDSVNIFFTAIGYFDSTNVFVAQLSDEYGNFTVPDTIGILNDTVSGIIPALIPSGLTMGTGYRIRVSSSAPMIDGADNGSNLSIFTYAVAEAGNDTAVCTGSSLTLTASGGLNYLWSTGENLQSIIVSPDAITTYYVTVSNAMCGSTDSLIVSLFPLPSANAGSDTTICRSDTASLSASGGISYLWSNGDTSFSINASPYNTTDFIVTVTDINGCTDSDTAIVIVNFVNTEMDSIQPICFGDSITLTAHNGIEYLWNTSDTTESVTIAPLVTTTYYVTVTGANTCIASDSVSVIVNPLPYADAGLDAALCYGDSAVLTATGGLVYQWNTGEMTETITVSPLISLEYYVTVTDINSCTSFDSIQVTVNHLPVADAGADATICRGDTATLTASGGISYQWSDGATTQEINISPYNTTEYIVTVTDVNNCHNSDSVVVTVNFVDTDIDSVQPICYSDSITLTAHNGVDYLWSTSDTTAAITVSPSLTTAYYVTVTGANTCIAYDSVIVIVNQLPDADAGLDVVVCFGDSAVLTATGGSVYEWNTEEMTETIIVSPLISLEYYVTVTDINSCTSSDSTKVTVNTLPVADAGADVTICRGDTATLTASGGISYQWSDGATTQEINISPYNTTEYIVTVTDINTCHNSDSAVVTVNFVATDIDSVQPLCYGDSITLLAHNGIDYLWSTSDTTAA